MIKQKKIVHRLIWSYTILLGLFTLIMLTIFFSLFNNQGLELHQEQMKEQGDTIAETIMSEGYLNSNDEEASMHQRMMKGNSHMSGVNNLLSLISKLSTDEIYIVTPQGESLFSSHMMSQKNQNDSLPNAGQNILNLVKMNQTNQLVEINEKDVPYTLGYGVPLTDDSTQLIGSVIVLSRKEHSLTKTLSDYRLLISSVVLALIVTIVISIMLARRFVKPIHEMESFTETLINSNYGDSIEIATQDELSKLGNKLSILSKRLLEAQKEQTNKEKNQKLFLSQISHELRTPVMVIKNSLEGLQGDFLSEEEKEEYIKHLLHETNQMNRLVNDLLELTRLESTDFSIHKEPLSLPDVCQDSVRSFRDRIRQNNQQIEITNELLETDIFTGDYQRMSQLIKILLDNSVKYSPNNSLISINLYKDKSFICIDVMNDIKKATDLPNEKEMFKAFSRGKHAEVEGHGLGLTIAEEITKRHNGKIAIKKTNGNQLKVSLIFNL